MTASFSRRIAPLARSMPYSVRLLSKSAVAGEFRYFGPSASGRIRPPRPMARPLASRIGMMIRPRKRSYTPPRVEGEAMPASVSSASVKPLARSRVLLTQPPAATVLAGRSRAQLDAGTLRKPGQGLAEVEPVAAHDEGEDV